MPYEKFTIIKLLCAGILVPDGSLDLYFQNESPGFGVSWLMSRIWPPRETEPKGFVLKT